LQAKIGKLICGGAALVVFGGLISMFGGLSPPKLSLALAPVISYSNVALRKSAI